MATVTQQGMGQSVAARPKAPVPAPVVEAGLGWGFPTRLSTNYDVSQDEIASKGS